jgi:hypothetical protein
MINSLDSLLGRFREAGAIRLLCKPLAENDNNKQQIYLGRDFSAINLLPFDEVTETTGGARPTMKAPIRLSWMDSCGHVAPAPGAQLILYPGYPEVRLSGFVRGCPTVPSEDLRPVPASDRRFDNAPDGRLLFLAILPSRSVIAHLARPDSEISREFHARNSEKQYHKAGVFFDVPLLENVSTRQLLLSDLRWIHAAGWHESVRLFSDGVKRPYRARNGGGYTLEALLGIMPNSNARPDYLGWEIKAISSSRITLMTPEPDRGFYGENGVAAFVRRYGSLSGGSGRLYFTGTHKSGIPCKRTGLVLTVRGLDATGGRFDPRGGVFLEDKDGREAAGWSFSRLVSHWGRKHAAAAYIPYESSKEPALRYRYLSPVLLGEGTSFLRFLFALCSGDVIYDPGSRVDGSDPDSGQVKARSQFRVSRKALPGLYDRFSVVYLD